MPHRPSWHCATACGSEQAPAHEPQWLASLLRFTSQPSTCLLLLQSAKPMSHGPSHTLPVQVGLARCAFEHTTPHAERWLRVLASQPFGCLLPSQSAKPVSQVPLQVDIAQLGVAMWLLEQARPQPPHAATFAVVGVSQPFATLPSQLAKPASQVM